MKPFPNSNTQGCLNVSDGLRSYQFEENGQFNQTHNNDHGIFRSHRVWSWLLKQFKFNTNKLIFTTL